MVYNIGLQRYRDLKIRVCDKDSIPLINNLEDIVVFNSHNVSIVSAAEGGDFCRETAIEKKQSKREKLIIFI